MVLRLGGSREPKRGSGSLLLRALLLRNLLRALLGLGLEWFLLEVLLFAMFFGHGFRGYRNKGMISRGYPPAGEDGPETACRDSSRSAGAGIQ